MRRKSIAAFPEWLNHHTTFYFSDQKGFRPAASRQPSGSLFTRPYPLPFSMTRIFFLAGRVSAIGFFSRQKRGRRERGGLRIDKTLMPGMPTPICPRAPPEASGRESGARPRTASPCGPQGALNKPEAKTLVRGNVVYMAQFCVFR